MPKCSQCDREAMYNFEGHYLCLACYEKLNSIQAEEYWRLTSAMNDNIQMMEITAGLPAGTLGRYKIPSNNTINNTVNNTFNINRSIVGTINTGYANEIYSNLEKINQSVLSDDIVLKLKDFIENLSMTNELDIKNKSELLEQMTFLTEELIKEKGNRKTKMVMDALGNISKVVSTIDSLKKLFEPIYIYFLAIN